MGTPKDVKPPSGGGGSAPAEAQEKKEPTLLERIEKGDELTPEELAQATDNAKPRVAGRLAKGESPGDLVFSVAHQAAAQLHGWAAHNLHSTEPFKLTLKAYEAALKAALSGEKPHEPACSKHLPSAHKARLDEKKETSNV